MPDELAEAHSAGRAAMADESAVGFASASAVTGPCIGWRSASFMHLATVSVSEHNTRVLCSAAVLRRACSARLSALLPARLTERVQPSKCSTSGLQEQATWRTLGTLVSR